MNLKFFPQFNQIEVMQISPKKKKKKTTTTTTTKTKTGAEEDAGPST